MTQTPISFKNLAQIEELLFLSDNLLQLKQGNEKIKLAHSAVNFAWRIIKDEKEKKKKD